MSEPALERSPLGACLDRLERRLPDYILQRAFGEAHGHLLSSRFGRGSRRTRDEYKYGSVSSTFREVFRQETRLNPWRDGYLPPARQNDLWQSSRALETGPSAIPVHLFATAAVEVLSMDDIDELDEFLVRQGGSGVAFDGGSPLLSFVSLLDGASTAAEVSRVLGPRHGPVVAASAMVMVLARALDMAEQDTAEARPDFGVGTFTGAVEPLLDLARAAVLMRSGSERGADIGSRSDALVLEEKLEQYREYVWSSVAAYESVRSEHIAATSAIERDMEVIRKEDRQWEDVVRASELIAATPPPPSVASEVPVPQVSIGSARPSPAERHAPGCRCRACAS